MAETVEVLGQARGWIDLVMLDLVLPRRAGGEACRSAGSAHLAAAKSDGRRHQPTIGNHRAEARELASRALRSMSTWHCDTPALDAS